MSTTPTCTENWTENWTENVDSLTADGRIVHVRALGPCDLEQLVALHERASDRSIYLRFFNLNRSSALAYAQHLVDPE
ncbi:MAG: hypothetical protein J0H43_13980, partial [Actinobacteria bacterium]|nr:hypothetical protein [Actinomycetota bacterium]